MTAVGKEPVRAEAVECGWMDGMLTLPWVLFLIKLCVTREEKHKCKKTTPNESLMQKITKQQIIYRINRNIHLKREILKQTFFSWNIIASRSTRQLFSIEWLADVNSAGWLFVRRQQTCTMMRNCPDHAADSSNHLPVASKADKKQMMSVPPPYWVISLIECNWAMHRSVERQHRPLETAGRGGAQELLSNTCTVIHGFII